jgi:mono/diheme cytochrome c family protein
MYSIVKWSFLIIGGLVLLVSIAVAGVHFISNIRIDTEHTVAAIPIAIPSDAQTIARGEHLALTRGCLDCHGEKLDGKAVIDAQPMGRIYAPNITPGGLAASYNDQDWIRAIRHGVKPDGRSVLLMPSYEYYFLDDRDLGALIAYLKQIPTLDTPSISIDLGPIGRLLILSDQLRLAAEYIDHTQQPPTAPPAAPTATYGAYLAVTCIGCHGENFVGGPIPGGDPSWPPATNLRPDEAGIGSWNETDFVHAMRQGLRPDGTSISPVMPRKLGHFTDEELRAIWLYLRAL